MSHQYKNKYHIWIEDERDPVYIRKAATITGHDLAFEFALFLAASRHKTVWMTAKDNRLIHRIPG